MSAKVKGQFYDSHPELPLDPDGVDWPDGTPMAVDLRATAALCLGAALGAFAWYGLGILTSMKLGHWPFIQLVVVVLGALCFGYCVELFHEDDERNVRRTLVLLFGSSLLGAFSAFGLLAATITQFTGGYRAVAMTYAAATFVLGVGVCLLGIKLARTHNHQYHKA